MSFFLVAAAVALGVALISGGSLRPLLETRLRGTWALFVALGLQAVLDLFWRPVSPSSPTPGGGLTHVLLVLSYLLLVGFCLANFTLRGMTVVAIGIALNGLAVTMNHGMPVRADGVKTTVKHHAERPSDRLTGLGDIIVVDPLNQALSFGDLILAVGLADVFVHRSRPGRRGWRSDDRPAVEESAEATVAAA
jgi:hypothetical protein